jgi:glycosyltransferase involved in cell wall biosynthesis
MPLVILEAMSVGKPIIASNIGAIPEMVKDNKNGFLISTGNEQQLADRIKIFVDKPELVDKLGEESKRIFQSRYTRQHFTKKLEQVFFEIINSGF